MKRTSLEKRVVFLRITMFGFLIASPAGAFDVGKFHENKLIFGVFVTVTRYPQSPRPILLSPVVSLCATVSSRAEVEQQIALAKHRLTNLSSLGRRTTAMRTAEFAPTSRSECSGAATASSASTPGSCRRVVDAGGARSPASISDIFSS